MSTPAFTSCLPLTGVELPHLTWHPRWRRPLLRFGTLAACGLLPRVERRPYEAIPTAIQENLDAHLAAGGALPRNVGGDRMTWHLDVDSVRDVGLREELMDLARGLYAYEPPIERAVMLDGLIRHVGTKGILELVAWLRAALVELAGSEYAAIASPTGNSGGGGVKGDGRFPPHSDMWVPGLLFNVFNRTVKGEGATLLLEMKHAWSVMEEAGMPVEQIQDMCSALPNAGQCDYFDHFNGFLYDNHPWSLAVGRALEAASITVHLRPGQGYLIDDRTWLHGRGALALDRIDPDVRDHRLYRIAFNNARMQAQTSAIYSQRERDGMMPFGCR